jgi:predicted amidophosphoribosyltransferase
MRALKNILSAASSGIEIALDCVMPPYEGVRELERMSATELVAAIESDEESKKSRPLPVEGLVVAFPYRARLAKAAIVLIKSHLNRPVARLLAEAAYMKMEKSIAAFAASAPDGAIPILAPMPMTKKRRRERGWSQCELICEAMARIDGAGRAFIYMEDALVRTRETEDQVGMGKDERAANMRGSFGAGLDADGIPHVRGRDVIILDDVATTGATLREARAAALAAGARRILLLSIGY